MREVRNQDWGALCERLNQFEDGANVTIEVLEHDGTKSRLASDMPFEEVAITRDDCNDHFIVRARGNHATEVDIVEPIAVKLGETEGGAAFNSVIIEAESGVTTLTFHPVIRKTWLEGLPLL